MNRYDYIKYDAEAASAQASLKEEFTRMDRLVEKLLPSGRAKSLIFTKLEEAYMWCGKAIRDEQQIRNAGNITLQEERGKS